MKSKSPNYKVYYVVFEPNIQNTIEFKWSEETVLLFCLFALSNSNIFVWNKYLNMYFPIISKGNGIRERFMFVVIGRGIK